MTDKTFSNFDAFIKEVVKKDTFKDEVTGSVLGNIKDDSAKRGVVEAALRCIIGGPRGVGRMPETKPFNHIKNKKNWTPFCSQLLKYLKEKHSDILTTFQADSQMYISYRSFWPDCEADLSRDVENARKQQKEQAKEAKELAEARKAAEKSDATS
jgi:hypothetical protein